MTQTSGPLVITGLEGLEARVGQTVGVSDWKTVEQNEINTFAKLTGDEQWIHVDPERAKETAVGTTIQHGFLTLGMSTGLLWQVCVVEGFGMILNYGLNKVRFVSPVPSGSRVRPRIVAGAVEEIGGAIQVTWTITVEREHHDKPACVAEWIVRYYMRGD